MKIKFDNVSCGYHKKAILKDLNFELFTGESVCILGANGIGKTTIFRTLLGFIEVISGDIFIDNRSIRCYLNKELARVLSYVPQAKNYSYQFSVRDIVLMGRALYIRKFDKPSKTDYEMVDNVLERLGISEYAEKHYSELSGGEQQIVLIARALAQQARFVLMDEPASNLDFKNQKKMLDVIKLLTSEGTGVLMVSHLPDHAFSCCSKAILLDQNGNFVFGAVSDVITSGNLSTIYGVDISVMSENDIMGRPIRTCYLQ